MVTRSSRCVVGLDLSLTATGVARFGGDEPEGTWTIKSKGKTEDPLPKRAERLADLDVSIRSMIGMGAYVYVERPAFASQGGSHHDRSGLWWLVVSTLIAQGFHVTEVSPSTVKKYATGKGNASKMEVMAQQIRRFPDIEIRNDNEADAFTLAAIGRRLIGEPLEESLPKVNLSALDVLSQVGT